MRGILSRGGTILGSSRTNPYKRDDGVQRVRQTLTELNVDALIAIGGENALGVANKLHQERMNVIGVPKTIDSDLGATDVTFGLHTALQIATDAIDRLHTPRHAERQPRSTRASTCCSDEWLDALGLDPTTEPMAQLGLRRLGSTTLRSSRAAARL